MKELTNEKLTTTNNEDNFLELCKICLSAYSLLPKIASSIDSLVVAKASATGSFPQPEGPLNIMAWGTLPSSTCRRREAITSFCPIISLKNIFCP